MKSAICSVLLFLVIVNLATGQNLKHRSKYFQNYQVDTIHIDGDPVAIKRNVIAIQHEEGIRSAFWDENDQTLTVEYDAGLCGLDIVRQYFLSNLKVRMITIVVPRKILAPKIYR
jgi:hypothetical protein